MLKSISLLIAALVFGWVLAGSATSASAHYRHAGCCGGPVPPTYVYKTIHTHKSYTRYHDVSVYHHVHRIHRVIHVTRIQPIIDVHNITRYHHHTIVHVRDRYEHVTQYLPPIRHAYSSSQSYYDCRCGHPHHCRY